MMNNCIFCEGDFADPIQPHNRQKICVLFDVSFNGKKLLHDSKICTRCQVQVDLIDNAVRLKAEMNQCLQDKLVKHMDLISSSSSSGNGAVGKVSPLVKSEIQVHSPPTVRSPVAQHAPAVPPPAVSAPPPHPAMMMAAAGTAEMMAAAGTAEMMAAAGTAEMMAMATMQAALAASAPLLTLPQPEQAAAAAAAVNAAMSRSSAAHSAAYGVSGGKANSGVYMCVHCGKACNDHTELAAHDAVCASSRTNNETTPMSCDRCGQSLKYRSTEDRMKHIVQCKGQGLRRGRPSTGIVNCPKCNLSLKNRMNHDRINHVNRCNGNGLKRGRPSMKSVDKYQCEKCHRNLWSQEQLQLHLTKCDGSHVERRGRKPGDNSCMVCGENLIYRHILKKHLRQAHGINPQNLDDSVIAAVRNEHSVDELSTPYKRILLNQIQQHLTSTSSLPADALLTADSHADRHTDRPAADRPAAQLPVDQADSSEESLSQSFDSSSHRKKARPCKYVAEGGREAGSEESLPHITSTAQQMRYEAVERMDSSSATVSPAADSPAPSASDEDQNAGDVDMEGGVDDVISAISARAEYKQQLAAGSLGGGARGDQPSPTAAVKGSAIAQVISGLLGANKASTATTSASAGISTSHRLSIST